jgi:OmcA/MtrC family decaheme c-type cytochrome
VPRALWTSGVNSAVSFLIGGPFAGEGPEYGYRVYGTIAWPRSETVPVETVADAQGLFEYPFVEAVPEAATGAWTVVSSARRSAATRHYDVVTKRFGWPYTGETVSEVAIQNVVHVDTGTGAWALGDPRPASARRSVVDQAKCEACHRRLAFHGGTRNAVEGCLLCHTPERTDWNQRPKDPATGIVDLAATYDGVEEQSVHFKRMVLRIHTGSGQGTAVLGVEPYVVHGYGKRPFFFGEGTLPDELRRCDRCHLDGTWRIDALPEGAGATVANETATLRHANSVLHVDEAPVLPMRAACTSCHGNAYAAAHAARNTVNGEEGCLACHGARGTKASDKVHGLPATTSP